MEIGEGKLREGKGLPKIPQLRGDKLGLDLLTCYWLLRCIEVPRDPEKAREKMSWKHPQTTMNV